MEKVFGRNRIMRENFILSSLEHTWLLDIDGTVAKHNGYLIDGEDTLLPGAREFLDTIPKEDTIIFLTSRKKQYAGITKDFLRREGIRYDDIIFEIPYGERIVINDKKPSGLETAKAINLQRDEEIDMGFSINPDL